MPKRAALYLRVSTGEQTTENQRRDLEDVAQRSGWEIVAVYEDAGVSGVGDGTCVLHSISSTRMRLAVRCGDGLER
jgi:DNA invertase Pin-like site-specific DNA recombinase